MSSMCKKEALDSFAGLYLAKVDKLPIGMI
jgi:hypothetical protein